MKELKLPEDMADAAIADSSYSIRVKVDSILAIAEAFRDLEQKLKREIENHMEVTFSEARWKQLAEAAETKLAELARRPPVGNFYEDGPGNWWQIGPHDKVPHVTPLFDRPAPAAEEKLADLEKQASEQKPFMYGIMTANGDAHFEDFCVSSDPALLEDEIWEWNNRLADNEPKSRVVALFTRPAPAVSLAELVPDAKEIRKEAGGYAPVYSLQEQQLFIDGATWLSATILRNIEDVGKKHE